MKRCEDHMDIAGGQKVPGARVLASVPTVFTSGPNTGSYSGGFGTIVREAGTAGQRAGMIVGRFQF